MDKVTPKCPYCGTEMELDRTYKSMIAPEAGVTYWYSCDVCGSESPRCNSPESAYAAAMKRYVEPNRVLTLEEVESGEIIAAWEENRRYSTELGGWTLCSAEEPAMEHYGIGWRMWLRRPTDEERAATPWAQIDA